MADLSGWPLYPTFRQEKDKGSPHPSEIFGLLKRYSQSKMKIWGDFIRLPLKRPERFYFFRQKKQWPTTGRKGGAKWRSEAEKKLPDREFLTHPDLF